MQNVFGEMKKNPAEFEYCKNFISLGDFLENRESDDHVDAYLEQWVKNFKNNFKISCQKVKNINFKISFQKVEKINFKISCQKLINIDSRISCQKVKDNNFRISSTKIIQCITVNNNFKIRVKNELSIKI